MKRFAVVVAVALAGCAVTYERPGVDQATAQKDARECAYDAERATVGIRDLGTQIGERANLNASCMASRGYAARFR